MSRSLFIYRGAPELSSGWLVPAGFLRVPVPAGTDKK